VMCDDGSDAPGAAPVDGGRQCSCHLDSPEIGTCGIPVEPADFHPGNSQAALCVGRMEKL